MLLNVRVDHRNIYDKWLYSSCHFSYVIPTKYPGTCPAADNANTALLTAPPDAPTDPYHPGLDDRVVNAKNLVIRLENFRCS